jgi:hypothetical protein
MLVVVEDVFVKDASQMPLVEDEDPIQAFASDGADPSFRVGVREWRPDRGSDGGDVFGREDRVERRDKESESRIKNRQVPANESMWLRACWTVQSPLGCVVIPANCTRRRSSSI